MMDSESGTAVSTSRVEEAVRALQREAMDSLEEVHGKLLHMVALHALRTHRFEDLFEGTPEERLVEGVRMPKDRTVRKWVLKVLPLVVASLVFVGLVVYYSVLYATSREDPSWELNVFTRDAIYFPACLPVSCCCLLSSHHLSSTPLSFLRPPIHSLLTLEFCRLLVCSALDVVSMNCSLMGSPVSDCATPSFLWNQVPQSGRASQWNCMIVNYRADVFLAGTDDLANGHFDVVVDTGGQSGEVIFNAVALTEDFQFSQVQSVAEKGSSAPELIKTLTRHPSTFQQFFVPTGVKTLLDFIPEAFSFLDSTLDFLRFRGIVTLNENYAGTTRVSMSFHSMQIFEYKEFLTQTTVDLLANLLVSTGALFSVLRMTHTVAFFLYQRWNRSGAKRRSRLHHLFASEGIPMEELTGGRSMEEDSWRLQRGLHAHSTVRLPQLAAKGGSHLPARKLSTVSLSRLLFNGSEEERVGAGAGAREVP